MPLTSWVASVTHKLLGLSETQFPNWSYGAIYIAIGIKQDQFWKVLNTAHGTKEVLTKRQLCTTSLEDAAG